MSAAVLGAIAGNGPEAPRKIQLAPLYPGNLFAALAGEEQEANDSAEVVIATRTPDGDQLLLAKHTIARALLGRSIGANNWVAIGKTRIAQLKKADSATRARFAAIGPFSLVISDSRTATARRSMSL